MARLERLVEGLAFAEGPRWHGGRLWYSDMHRRVVEAVTLDGDRETVCEVANDPSGLGFLPDGRLLVVSMRDRRLLRREDDGRLVEHADLSGLASFHLNDMVVDRIGRAYVGNFGFDLHHGAAPAFAELIAVEPDGSARVAAKRMKFPNGTVITPDGKTLIVGQSTGRDLVAFTISEGGDLVDRRQWADLGDGVPDGICLDAEGAVWYADPRNGACVRVAEGGRELDRVDTGRGCFACALGGPDRRHLFLATADDSSPEGSAARLTGRIEVVEVDAPGAGTP
jgi:sugar lactone lactonase YvrE